MNFWDIYERVSLFILISMLIFLIIVLSIKAMFFMTDEQEESIEVQNCCCKEIKENV